MINPGQVKLIRYFIRTRYFANLYSREWVSKIPLACRPSLTKPLIYTNILFYFLRLFSKYKSSSFISSAAFSSFLFLSSFFSLGSSLSILLVSLYFLLPSLDSSPYPSRFPLYLFSIPLSFFLASSLFLPVFFIPVLYSLLLILFSILLVSSLFLLYFYHLDL